jgi:hypothetical protein
MLQRRKSRFPVLASLAVSVCCLPQLAAAAHFVHPKAGYSLDYPEGWNVDWQLIGVDGPLELTTFSAGGYIHSGFLPPGGVDINVATFPSTTPEDVLLLRGSTSATDLTRSVQEIGHRRVLRADYDDHSMSPAGYRITSTCVRIDDKLFTILIRYEHTPPDPRETAHGEAALAQIISSLSTETTK